MTFRTFEDICTSYNEQAICESTIRALKDTPLDNFMTKHENEYLFQQSKTGRSGGPGGY